MGRAIETLAAGTGPIQARLQAAEPHFGRAFDCGMSDDAANFLRLRIGAALVEGEDEASSVRDSIAALDDARAADVARDMLRLYEVLAGLRSGDG